MPRIVVLATGGTISSRQTGSGGAVATDSAAELLSSVKLDSEGIRVEAIDLFRKNSFNLSMDDLRSVVTSIAEQLERDDIDGVVVTHGTDTMEETAFLADLVHRDERPVVFTGSQLSPDQDASDGRRNLSQAILVAASPRSRGLGALVSFAGDIFAARGVQKQHSLRMAPFGNSESGPIGHVIGDRVGFHASPVRKAIQQFPSEKFGRTRVDALLTYPGVDAVLFEAAIASGAAGVVIAGSGTGNTNPELVRAIAEATRRGIVVALGSRAGDGPVVPLYGGGGAVDAVAAGAVPTGFLPVTQSRILLALLLDHYPANEAAARLLEYCAA